MKNFKLLLVSFLLIVFAFSFNTAISDKKKLSEREKRAKINYKIDNINYWVKLAEKGYIPFNPYVRAPEAVFTGSQIKAYSVITDDSPDIAVTEKNSTQSENSVFVDPNDEKVMLNSNNSTPNPANDIYGANDLFTLNSGETFNGELEGAGESNNGDPTTAIGLNGRWFINYIDAGTNTGGMGLSYSDNQGTSWTAVNVAPNPGDLADKNHMWIDNSSTSPFKGNIYVAWTAFGGVNDEKVVISRSTDNGQTWSSPIEISSNASNKFSHGVNLTTGPNGEVYAAWAVYQGTDLTETAIGYAKSLDGGITWEGGLAITNIKGVREIGVSKNMRTASFPIIDCDISGGSNNGNLYIVWVNKGVPGVNTGNDIDVYIISSHDQGTTWNNPVKVNQDEAGLGHEHYSPWLACDPSNGILSVIFYDDRNVGGNQVETFCANSDDGGETWEDFKVSDVAFTPTPIPGLATGYFGDYIGITANNGMVYPTWTDNRSGHALTYVSPYETNPLNKPFGVTANVEFETGVCELNWFYEVGENFQHFNVYRDGELVGTATDTLFRETLPEYNYYTYKITAWYGEEFGGESGAAKVNTQWGAPHIATSLSSVYQKILIDSTKKQSITVYNTGQLDLEYKAVPAFKSETNANDYCSASGGGDEHISKVAFGPYINESGSDNYSDFTDLNWEMNLDDSFQLNITNGNPYSEDKCGVWIDWDGNGEFDDDPVNVTGSPGEGPYTALITPPENTKTGIIRMRIRITYSGDVLPCGTTEYGEVEDYSINIAWLKNTPKEGIIPPGDSAIIDLTFKATGTQPGSYFADLTFASNDPLLPESKVDVTMEVVDLLVEASANKDNICANETDSIQLKVNVQGSDDLLTYKWTSKPEGFISNTAETNVLPRTNTWYFINVSLENGKSYSDSVLIVVNDVPEVDLGPDSTFCGQNGEELILDAGNQGLTYLWSTGDITRTIVASKDKFGDYGKFDISVTVTTEHGCIANDTVMVSILDCSGIEDYNAISNVNIYPNPGTGLFSLQLNADSRQEVTLVVVDNQGKIVYRKKGISFTGQKTIQLDLRDKASGVYQLMIISNDNRINKKLIIK